MLFSEIDLLLDVCDSQCKCVTRTSQLSAFKSPTGYPYSTSLDKRETGENIAQGSNDGSLLSSSNLSSGVNDFFLDSECEVFYGLLKLLPQSFVDDIIRLCQDQIPAQFGNDRLENLAETKLLSYNLDKTCIIFMGAKKAREKLMDDFISNPPCLYGKPVKLLDAESYLGDVLGSSVSESISLTISKREGLARKAIFDIKKHS